MTHFKPILFIAIAMFILWSCSKEDETQPQSNTNTTDSISDNQETKPFSGVVYLTQAKDEQMVHFKMDNSPSERKLSVSIDGAKAASEEVSIQFSVDNMKAAEYNQKNGTGYKLLPQNVYSFSSTSVTINKGETVSNKLSLKFTPMTIAPGSYLLPLSIATDAGSIDNKLGTLYFLIDVPVISVKVLSLGTDWGDILSAGPDGILYRRDKKDVIWVYKSDQNGMYSADPTAFPGLPWGASGWFYCIRDSVEMVVNDDGYYGMWRFDIEPDTYFLTANETVNPSDPWPTNFGFYYSDGWNIYTLLPQDNFLFFWNKNTGEMLRAPMDAFLDPHPGTWNKIGVWINGGNRDVVSTNFKDYVQVLSFGKSLIGVKSDGTLWAYTVDKNGKLGDAEKLGVGWDKYVKLIASGNNILALDANGDLYEYKIDIDNFYDLTI